MPVCTERSRTYKSRQDISCIKCATISAGACLTLLKLWTSLVPGFFSALVLRKRVEFVYHSLRLNSSDPGGMSNKSLPCESVESGIREPRTSASTTSFPDFTPVLFPAPLSELKAASKLAAPAPPSLAFAPIALALGLVFSFRHCLR